MLLDTPSTTDLHDPMHAPLTPTSADGSGSTASTSSTAHPGLRARFNSALAGLNSLPAAATAKAPRVSEVQKGVRRYHAMISHGQYKETTDLQLAITAQGRVVKATDGLGKDEQKSGQALEKWGSLQDDAQEVVTSTAEIGSLRSTVGDLYAAHARALEQARLCLKDVRNYENDLVVRRRAHATLSTKLTDADRKAAAAPSKADLAAAALQLRHDHAASLGALELLAAGLRGFRQAKLLESFALEVAAYRELGDKLVSVGAYGESLVQGLERAGGVGGGEGGVGEEVYAGWGERQEGRTPTERWTPTPSRQGSEGWPRAGQSGGVAIATGVGGVGAGPGSVGAPVPAELQDPWRDVPTVDPLPRYESGAPTGAAEALAGWGEVGQGAEDGEGEVKEKAKAEVKEV